MKKIRCVNLSLFVFVLLTGCASYPHIDTAVLGVRTDNVQVQLAFGDHDRRVINDYYSSRNVKQKSLPPGLAKKGKLTPGHKKQLMKNNKLPYGLAKRSLPAELEKRLSRLPEGYVRLKVGSDIVLMKEGAEVVVDIIYDVG